MAGVLDSFIQWCEQVREDFDLGEGIDSQLARRKRRLELNKSYGQWREMARKMGFVDDPKRGDKEMLRLSIETVPVWTPGWSMRGGGKESISSPADSISLTQFCKTSGQIERIVK